VDTPWAYTLHGMPRASVRHATPVNVLVPLKDVKYEVDLEIVACPPYLERGHCRLMDFGAYI